MSILSVCLLLCLALLFGGFAVFMMSMFQIFGEARRAGHSFGSLYFFGAFRYAFNEKKGSAETRRLMLGLGAMLASVLLGVVIGALAPKGF